MFLNRNQPLSSDTDILTGITPRHSKRAKRLSLRVNPKDSVIELVIPPRASQGQIKRFVTANRDWVEQRLNQLPQKQVIEHGTKILFRGHDTKIAIEHYDKRSTQITHENNIIHIQTARSDGTSNLKRWVIEQARAEIEPLAKAKAASINKPVSKIDLRDTSSRWGSCSSDGRLMLSWRLIFAPHYVLDYVVGHEVAHLKHMDHSSKFWELCHELCDEPDRAKTWLKKNGNMLLRVF